MPAVICPICAMSLTNSNILKVHINLHCRVCGKFFMSHNKLKEHTETHSSTMQVKPLGNITSCKHCKECNETLPSSLYHTHVRSNKHKNNCLKVRVNGDLTVRTSEFNGRIETYSYINKKEEVLYPEEFFGEAENVVINQLADCGFKHTTFKFNMELLCEYMKLIDDSLTIAPIGHISKMMLVTASDDIHECYKKHAEEIAVKMSEFQERDSGWTLLTIKSLEININKCSIIRGSQYIPLPRSIANIHACINVENRDVYCFKWCLIAAFYSGNQLNARQRKTCNSYEISDIESDFIIVDEIVLNFQGMQFPAPLKQIRKFEKQNSISINVFGYNGHSIVGPYYITTDEKPTHLNLLLLTSGDKSHYVLISDISK